MQPSRQPGAKGKHSGSPMRRPRHRALLRAHVPHEGWLPGTLPSTIREGSYSDMSRSGNLRGRLPRRHRRRQAQRRAFRRLHRAVPFRYEPV
jgi:hypothetical protein